MARKREGSTFPDEGQFIPVAPKVSFFLWWIVKWGGCCCCRFFVIIVLVLVLVIVLILEMNMVDEVQNSNRRLVGLITGNTTSFHRFLSWCILRWVCRFLQDRSEKRDDDGREYARFLSVFRPFSNSFSLYFPLYFLLRFPSLFSLYYFVLFFFFIPFFKIHTIIPLLL